MTAERIADRPAEGALAAQSGRTCSACIADETYSFTICGHLPSLGCAVEGTTQALYCNKYVLMPSEGQHCH